MCRPPSWLLLLTVSSVSLRSPHCLLSPSESSSLTLLPENPLFYFCFSSVSVSFWLLCCIRFINSLEMFLFEPSVTVKARLFVQSRLKTSEQKETEQTLFSSVVWYYSRDSLSSWCFCSMSVFLHFYFPKMFFHNMSSFSFRMTFICPLCLFMCRCVYLHFIIHFIIYVVLLNILSLQAGCCPSAGFQRLANQKKVS